MRNERRINLCFNLDDPRQKAVYEYLISAGREKSSTVVSIILQHIASDNRWRNDMMEREVRFAERFESIVKQVDAQRAERMKTELFEILKDFNFEKPKQSSSYKTVSGDEMSDDAFDAVMALMG